MQRRTKRDSSMSGISFISNAAISIHQHQRGGITPRRRRMMDLAQIKKVNETSVRSRDKNEVVVCNFSQPPISSFSQIPSDDSDDDDYNDIISKLRVLQSNLDKSIEQEDFSTAAKIRDKIKEIETNAHPESTLSVILANDNFYNAYRKGNVSSMCTAWLNTDTVSCTHALNGIVTGFDNVIDSWRKIFTMGKPSSIEVEVLSIEICRNLAWIVCKQVITSMRAGEVIGGERVATNLFQRSHGKWLIVHHHASPVVVDDASDDNRNNNDNKDKD